MKKFTYLMTTLLALALIGCGPKTDTSAPAGGTGAAMPSIDLSGFKNSFASAETSLKSSAEKAMSAVQSGDFKGALSELQSLAKNASLSAEQKSSLEGLITKVKDAITAAAGKAMEGAGKALGDAQKAITK
jgi:hypothetical protein